MSNDDIQTIIDLVNEVTDPAQAERISRAAAVRVSDLQREAATSSFGGAVFPSRTINEAGFCIGDKVEFGSMVSPRYLIGRKGMVVTKVNRKSVKVRVPDEVGFGRFQGKQNVGCPNSIIRKSEG